ncbi:MAG: hypothetical protein PHO08_05925 [Methylococcales bacterium]|nr:hypothetical protein [Methylococcales bacterium]
MKDFELSHLDFSKLIEERTRQFTGREWVFNAINYWLNDEKGARVFLLAGDPGTGKTAIAARVVKIHLGKTLSGAFSGLSQGFLAYYHFCQAGQETTLSPLTFVEQLSQALATRYPAYRGELEKLGSQQFVINSVVTVNGPVDKNAKVVGADIGTVRIEILGGDARPLFDQMVRRPLRAFCESHPQESIVILVDSLDEALSFNPENNIAQLLRLVGDFPSQVRFLVTCRSKIQRVFDLVGKPALDLIADAPAGLDDVRAYAASRLNAVPEPGRSAAAERIAEKSEGNFLYAYHILNDLERLGADLDRALLILPDKLEGVYREFLQRELASTPARWNDVYRPILGLIAVALGEGLTKAQLIGITGLGEDTATDVLTTCEQYLIGGETASPYRIYHQSFRDFLLSDEKFTVFPAERHAAIARYLQDEFGGNWSTCKDNYALRYTPAHLAEAAALSEAKRETRTQALIELTQNQKYQRRFEHRGENILLLKEYLHRTVELAALNQRDDMLPWLIKATQGPAEFHRNYLQAGIVVNLAEQGKLDQAQARLQLFSGIDVDWKVAARLIIAWLGVEQNPTAAMEIFRDVTKTGTAGDILLLLSNRVGAALNHKSSFSFEPRETLSIAVAQELVKRINGRAFDREILLSVNPSLIVVGQLGSQLGITGLRGYAAATDAPILVNLAREQDMEGTPLVDQYIDAHARYNYVEYRNRSLWFVLQAVLRHHPEQYWVKERLGRILKAALTEGNVDFREILPLTALLLLERASKRDARLTAEHSLATAIRGADELQSRRGADDSWGNHKRRLTGLMELYQLLLKNGSSANELLARILALPGGFAGFQAPAFLRLADALRACGINRPGLLEAVLEDALRSAHHIQDYHFCARVTARCNALKRWHQNALTGQELANTIRRLAALSGDAEFAADHLVHEPYQYREENDPDTLSIAEARGAENLEQLAEVFQRPAVEFRRLNPQYGLTQALDENTPIRVPDPGLAPLLAVHFAARALADDSLEEEHGELFRALVPFATRDPTALDSLLSYLLIASDPDDPEVLEDIVREAGPVVFSDVTHSTAQIGPDAATPV